MLLQEPTLVLCSFPRSSWIFKSAAILKPWHGDDSLGFEIFSDRYLIHLWHPNVANLHRRLLNLSHIEMARWCSRYLHGRFLIQLWHQNVTNFHWSSWHWDVTYKCVIYGGRCPIHFWNPTVTISVNDAFTCDIQTSRTNVWYLNESCDIWMSHVTYKDQMKLE